MAEVDKDDLLRYACEDADITYKLTEIFAPKLRENNLQELFEQGTV